MRYITEPSKTVLQILRKAKSDILSLRMLWYCVNVRIGEEYLLFNMLTREMVLLSSEEWKNHLTNDYLKSHWFVVPEDTNDKEYGDLVYWVLENKQKRPKNITGYTIYPTTDCNARCFYCFELGRSRKTMSAETAHKVANYIADHCGEEKASISWFGGEPLYNQMAIDIICTRLREMGVEFSSSVVSNGYLFDDATVVKAAQWNLKWVQITLDGTEAVYNKVKAYIYRQGNPYETVLDNIGRLLDASIAVSIRLNMDMHNAEDLLSLVEELAARFRGKKGLTVYAHHIFKGNEPMAESHSADEWAVREEAMIRLEDRIEALGLASKAGISKNVKMNFCMADSGRSVTILPGGEIGLCEHFSESEFIGHIDREGFDQTVVDSWKERIPEIPECATCFYYPQCRQLKKCASGSVCFDVIRREKLRKVKRQMLNEYERWKKQEASQEEPEDIDC